MFFKTAKDGAWVSFSIRERVALLQMPSYRKFWVHPLSSRYCLI